MKQSIIGLKIGIYVNASNIIYHYSNPSSQDCKLQIYSIKINYILWGYLINNNLAIF